MWFVSPNTGYTYNIIEEDMVYRRRYVGIIYAQCDVPGVEKDDITIFLPLLWSRRQSNRWIQVLHPEPGIKMIKCELLWS